MSSLSSGNVMPKGIRILLLGLLITALFIIVSPFNSDASREAVDFYSLKSPPPGINSLEALIARWWNWWENHPSDTAHHWPVCLKQDGNVGNQSVVFLANPAYSD